jgi:PH (Pleckstrin Homology) domain-containing protein
MAPMSPQIRVLTLGLLLLPLALFAGALIGPRLMAGPALLVVAIYAWIWLRFRPTRFVVGQGELEVIWPLKRRTLRREDVADVRLMDRRELRHEVGWCMRVGAGGLWGGFGWLWTQRRGIVQMYVSRTDGLVWIECVAGRPWLITPEQPEAFVRALSS